MALPKRKTSKSRRDKRRTHVKTDMPPLSDCPECKRKKLNHAVCGSCGFYNGKKIIATHEEELQTREEKQKNKKLSK